jgi:hypothetical protein
LILKKYYLDAFNVYAIEAIRGNDSAAYFALLASLMLSYTKQIALAVVPSTMLFFFVTGHATLSNWWFATILRITWITLGSVVFDIVKI